VAGLRPGYTSSTKSDHPVLVTVSGVYLSTARGDRQHRRSVRPSSSSSSNTYTAEGLAISTSDSSGSFNLAALIAMQSGARGRLRMRCDRARQHSSHPRRWTSPLMTPYVLPGCLAVMVTGWPDRAGSPRALAVVLRLIFGAPLVWMGVMA